MNDYMNNKQNNNYQQCQYSYQNGSKKQHTALIVILIVAGVIIFAFIISNLAVNTKSGAVSSIKGDYIGELNVEGAISEGADSGIFSDDTDYDHEFTLNSIDEMIKDDDNYGLLIYLNTPGGSVYASDELYNKIVEYKKETGRPVYAYMGNMAASGGYYVAAGCDKIIANRNCWTGSIGVTMGTLYDVTGFLSDLGIKTNTITSGRNKAIGSSTTKMTREQRHILQGLIDEAYEQFVNIVASGRGMDIRRVKRIADGRIYTAKQAKKNGLIDSVATYDEAIKIMKKNTGVKDNVEVKKLFPTKKSGLMETLFGAYSGSGGFAGKYNLIKSFLTQSNTISLTYMSNIRK